MGGGFGPAGLASKRLFSRKNFFVGFQMLGVFLAAGLNLALSNIELDDCCCAAALLLLESTDLSAWLNGQRPKKGSLIRLNLFVRASLYSLWRFIPNTNSGCRGRIIAFFSRAELSLVSFSRRVHFL